MNPQPQTTQTETSREIRAPYNVRDKMSRHSSSVPIQCARDGEASLEGRFWAAGLAGAIQGASRATNNRITAAANPTRAKTLWARNSRAARAAVMTTSHGDR